MRERDEKTVSEKLRVRCTHCRAALWHDPHNGCACIHCGSQLAMYAGQPIMIARNAADGLPLHKLDPKKKKVLIPGLSRKH